jgi:hypothetical protein
MKRKTDIGVKIKFSTFKNLKLLTDSYAFVMLMVFLCNGFVFIFVPALTIYYCYLM